VVRVGGVEATPIIDAVGVLGTRGQTHLRLLEG